MQNLPPSRRSPEELWELVETAATLVIGMFFIFLASTLVYPGIESVVIIEEGEDVSLWLDGSS